MTTRASRKSSGKYQKWTKEEMILAMQAVDTGKMGLNKAAKNFGVPKTTLRRHLQGKNKHAIAGKKCIGRQPDLSVEIEKQLADHVIEMKSRLYGLTTTSLGKLAYEIAVANNIKARFNHEKQMAGKEWCYGFLKRYPEISLRMPEPSSLARASGFNSVQVNTFFDLLDTLIQQNNITADRIYNMDDVQKVSKVLAKKEKHQMEVITSRERGENVTIICCVNAAGYFIPPGMIFPRSRMKPELQDGAPPGTMFSCQEKGLINGDLFHTWLEHFIRHAHPSDDNKVILVLDGRKSHTHNLKALQLASASGVIMLSLPPHTSHWLQPLDVSFFKLLKTYYHQQITQWMRTHPGRPVTQFQISRLFGLAYGKAACVSTAVNGFRKSGVFPVDPTVFDDSDFVPADATDKPNASDDNNGTSSQNLLSLVNVSPLPAASSTKLIPDADSSIDAAGGYSDANSLSCTVNVISPLLKKIHEPNMKRRSTSKPTVLTSSPYKRDIAAKQQMSKPKEAKRVIVTEGGGPAAKSLGKSSTSSGVEVNRAHENIMEAGNQNEEYACLVCGENTEDDWIQCAECRECADECFVVYEILDSSRQEKIELYALSNNEGAAENATNY